MTRPWAVFLGATAVALAASGVAGADARLAWLTVWPVAAVALGLQARIGAKVAPLGWWVAVAIRSAGGLIGCLLAERWSGAGVGENRALWFWFLGHYWTSLLADAVTQLWRPDPAKRG